MKVCKQGRLSQKYKDAQEKIEDLSALLMFAKIGTPEMQREIYNLRQVIDHQEESIRDLRRKIDSGEIVSILATGTMLLSNESAHKKTPTV
jgi:uncharacterized protein YaaN involved in tellurite resistance